jgi:hypothetical protein
MKPCIVSDHTGTQYVTMCPARSSIRSYGFEVADQNVELARFSFCNDWRALSAASMWIAWCWCFIGPHCDRSMLSVASTVFVSCTTAGVFSLVSVSTDTDVTVGIQTMLMCEADPLLARQRQHNGKNCD